MSGNIPFPLWRHSQYGKDIFVYKISKMNMFLIFLKTLIEKIFRSSHCCKCFRVDFIANKSDILTKNKCFS